MTKRSFSTWLSVTMWVGTFFLLSCGGSPSKRSSEPGPAKNVLLIVIDTLRADYLGCYGSQRVKSPNIDRLAAEGVRFANAFSHIPITGPSHASIFTSKYPSEAGVFNNGQVLAATETCLAEAMLESGRTTAGFISLGVLERRFGFAQGFQTYREDLGVEWQADAQEINAKVFEWIEEKPNRPYFAFVHYCDPHEPYYTHGSRETLVKAKLGDEILATIDIAKETLLTFNLEIPPGNTEISLCADREFRLRSTTWDPSESTIRTQPGRGWWRDHEGWPVSKQGTLLVRNETDEKRTISLNLYLTENLPLEEIVKSYALEVEFVDRAIGELLEKLRETNLLENTLIILTSDHGEGLGEHGEFEHITQLYDSLVHVPLILHDSTALPRGATIRDPVALLDLFPTILDVLGLPDNIDGGRGQNLLPLINGGDDTRDKYVYLETYAPEAPVDKFGLRTAKWKYIRTPETGEEELYHLVEDPKELNNRFDTNSDEIESFRALLESLGTGFSSDRSQPVLDEETLERLKRIGYVR